MRHIFQPFITIQSSNVLDTNFKFFPKQLEGEIDYSVSMYGVTIIGIIYFYILCS